MHTNLRSWVRVNFYYHITTQPYMIVEGFLKKKKIKKEKVAVKFNFIVKN